MIYRKATFNDIESIFALVNDYASDGIMLARSRNTLYETLRDMIVAEDETGAVVGVGGLHIVWDRMAEVRTMAISPAHTRRGIGAEIV
ncbi:GNAT family N-acetyltransferase, partial [Selenomonas sp.]|uniref:GNAT family N-acetyltransferase n=1 Tax=Selenomonas sp. TaxID=2053611 RepID=UPI002A75FA60